MATAAALYGSRTGITWTTFVSASSDASLIAGYQSAVVDNSADKSVDALVGGFVSTGTSPTASRQIEIWSYATFDGSWYTASCAATDKAQTLTAEEKSLLRLLAVIPTNATSSAKYVWGPVSIAQAYGGTMPLRWGLWGVHNTGVPLQSNNSAAYIPVKYTSA